MNVVQIIEDEAVLRDTMARTLTDDGFAVITAEDGVKGLEQALDKQPDLILLDIKMPNMSGYEMLKKLRARGSWGAGVPVVFLTNLTPSSDSEQNDIESVQPTAYLVKSETNLDELPAMVRKWLGS
jgi:DNA-binding response OmpR family regulator